MDFNNIVGILYLKKLVCLCLTDFIIFIVHNELRFKMMQSSLFTF